MQKVNRQAAEIPGRIAY